MKKQDQDLLIRVGVLAGAYFLVIKPLLEKLNLLPTKQEQQVSETEKKDLQQQQNLKPSGLRRYDDRSLTSLAKELYDSTNTFNYDYRIVLRSFAYFKGMRNADAQKFLSIFAKNNGLTLYQWYIDKFKNALNFERITNYPLVYPQYFKIFALMGYKQTLLNTSFDKLAEIAVSYVYLVAKVPKG